MEDEMPIACPDCGSQDIEIQKETPHTKDGFTENLYVFYCNRCQYEWQVEE